MLADASYSSEHLAHRLRHTLASNPLTGSRLKKYINEELVQSGLGIWNATDEELQKIIDHTDMAGYLFADMISRRAEIGWSTHGHSAVDVNIYGTAGSSALRGNHENTDIGKFLRHYLDVKVNDITEELKEANALRLADNEEIGWTGRIPSDDEIQSALQYHQQRYIST